MNMKRSEFVLGALSVAFWGCTKNIIANIKERIETRKRVSSATLACSR